ncbi:hypothetical protein GOARA_068_00690 [Gordonia araii NBRC 100433]|uniref:Uncharacterized protein n=1 Tax=Gordonia araii NBRC 100433 TaxID=1073574 RepID=G7H6D5_9ACTN|nr:hypothetical protein [Gordonia araii]NNG96091.1 hypothetical protein [Gordonia araii NBRC 100433]GAB11410.1 hypothetical protein GOARA_068_00690 [Gordonia araii NBRC 100433]
MTKRQPLLRTYRTPWKTPIRILVLVLAIVAILVASVLTAHVDRWVQAITLASIFLGYNLLVFVWWRRDRRAAESEEHR